MAMQGLARWMTRAHSTWMSIHMDCNTRISVNGCARATRGSSHWDVTLMGRGSHWISRGTCSATGIMPVAGGANSSSNSVLGTDTESISRPCLGSRSSSHRRSLINSTPEAVSFWKKDVGGKMNHRCARGGHSIRLDDGEIITERCCAVRTAACHPTTIA